MNALVISMRKGQRMDITAQMKDADAILELFRTHQIRFDKKYTTITDNGPSTITFKGVRSQSTQDKVADLLTSMHALARKNIIGNVYAKFISLRPRVTSLVSGHGKDKQELLVKQHLPEERKSLAMEVKNLPESDALMDFSLEIDMPDDTL